MVRSSGYSSLMGETIEFTGERGVWGGGYLATPEMGAGPALIVIQDPAALADHGHDVCDRFAAEGFTALAPALGSLTLPDRNGSTTEDLTAAIDLLKPHPAVRGQGVGVVGFAAGGGLALWLGTHRPEDVVAVVPYYGAVPDGAEPPDWSRLGAAVQGHFGEDDPACPPEAVASLEAALGRGRRGDRDVRLPRRRAGLLRRQPPRRPRRGRRPPGLDPDAGVPPQTPRLTRSPPSGPPGAPRTGDGRGRGSSYTVPR